MTSDISDIRQAFGQRVRALRKERGFSLRKFALTIGADKSYLVDIEYGRKSPTLDTVWRISSGLDVTMSYLLFEVDSHHGKEGRKDVCCRSGKKPDADSASGAEPEPELVETAEAG